MSTKKLYDASELQLVQIAPPDNSIIGYKVFEVARSISAVMGTDQADHLQGKLPDEWRGFGIIIPDEESEVLNEFRWRKLGTNWHQVDPSKGKWMRRRYQPGYYFDSNDRLLIVSG